MKGFIHMATGSVQPPSGFQAPALKFQPKPQHHHQTNMAAAAVTAARIQTVRLHFGKQTHSRDATELLEQLTGDLISRAGQAGQGTVQAQTLASQSRHLLDFILQSQAKMSDEDLLRLLRNDQSVDTFLKQLSSTLESRYKSVIIDTTAPFTPSSTRYLRSSGGRYAQVYVDLTDHSPLPAVPLSQIDNDSILGIVSQSFTPNQVIPLVKDRIETLSQTNPQEALVFTNSVIESLQNNIFIDTATKKDLVSSAASFIISLSLDISPNSSPSQQLDAIIKLLDDVQFGSLEALRKELQRQELENSGVITPSGANRRLFDKNDKGFVNV